MQEKFRKPYKAPRKNKMTKPKTAPSVSLAIKSYVKSEIKREDETKQKTVVAIQALPVNGAGLNAATPAGLLVQNKISNCRLKLTGFVLSSPYQSISNNNVSPFELHMIIYKVKDDPLGSPLLIMSNIGNTNIPIDGSVFNSCLMFNKDKYIIKKHTIFRLNAQPQPQTTPTTALLNPSNNSSKDTYFRRFSINVPISKTLKYADQSTTPSNDWFAVGFYYINGDGTTSDATQLRARVSMNATLYYDDS